MNAVCFASEPNFKGFTLKEIRHQLIDKEIIILGHSSKFDGRLSSWEFVGGNESDGYQFISRSYVPKDLRGTKGTIIAVVEESLNEYSAMTAKKDVFGKPVDAIHKIDPYVKIVVKLKDDKYDLIGVSTHYGIVNSNFQLIERANAVRKEVETHLSKLIGKNIYSTGLTKLLDPSLGFDELLDPGFRLSTMRRGSTIKNFTPLKVIEAKVFDEANAVIIKVELPDKEEKILFGDLEGYERDSENHEWTYFEKIGITAIEKIPHELSNKEVLSIKNSEIFRGMSEKSLIYSWGYPEKSNDWGRGGEQWVYSGNRFVYLTGKVIRDWQIAN